MLYILKAHLGACGSGELIKSLEFDIGVVTVGDNRNPMR